MAASGLTPAQRRHLGELREIARSSGGVAYWRPGSGGEWACARALERLGYLELEGHVGRNFKLVVSGTDEPGDTV